MVNTDRIVPVQKIDLLSLYATILNMTSNGEDELKILESETVDGQFKLSDAGFCIANQPVKKLTINTNGTVYFIADYDFDGFYRKDLIETVYVDTTGDEIVADGVTLYKAVISDDDVTITEMTPSTRGASGGGGK